MLKNSFKLATTDQAEVARRDMYKLLQLLSDSFLSVLRHISTAEVLIFQPLWFADELK